MKSPLRLFACLLVTGIVSLSAQAQAPAPAAIAPALFVPVSAPVVPPRTGVSERFDYTHAQTLDDWDGNPAAWTVSDGAFTAKASGAVPTSFLYTKKHFSDFRLILRCQVVESENHAGVALWGEQVPGKDPANRWATNGPLVGFPGIFLWDYAIAKSIPIDPAGAAWTKQHVGQHDWVQVEILAQGNRIRAAFNGHAVLDWRGPEPDKFKTGPIGLQLHGHAKPQEVIYKDVVIESFPTEDRLLTVVN